MDKSKVIYQVTDDSWWDGSEDCPCCSGLKFECYNAVDWYQNGSACSKEQLYKDVLFHYVTGGECYEDNPYENHYEDELLMFMDRFNIKVEWL
ncbi:hypothetical protein AXI76_gp184 [Pseudoalteromonas phage H101]|uniref:Uncharacterized protein n=1 Tax=Pseudoalteromonas phage H101 TaxID=1654919 RepID=A0A0H4J2B8_9CAUD|nr:hypothetical protein AXI76_gp184 [Pseudoalteromonas phage H101]AKO61085.1 hypothetical protein [Pseudoalteromonas phage H101]